jgi:WD40 repeat protein
MMKEPEASMNDQIITDDVRDEILSGFLERYEYHAQDKDAAWKSFDAEWQSIRRRAHELAMIARSLRSAPAPRPSYPWRIVRRVAGFVRTHPIAIAMFIVLALATVAGAWFSNTQIDRARTQGKTETLTEIEKRTKEEHVGWSILDKAWGSLQSPHPFRRRDVLDSLREAFKKLPDFGPAERDPFEAQIFAVYAAALALPDIDPPSEKDRLELPLLRALPWPVALSPKSQTMAIGLPDAPLFWTRGSKPQVPDIGGHNIPPLAYSPARSSILNQPRLAYSPDGMSLLFSRARDGSLLLYAKADEPAKQLVGPGDSPFLAVGFGRPAPDGQTLWAYRQDGMLFCFDATGKLLSNSVVRVPELGTLSAAAFNKDATWVAVGDTVGTVALFETRGMTKVVIRPSAEAGSRSLVQSLAWSPTEPVIAVGTKAGSLDIWTVTGAPSLHFVPFNNGVHNILFSADGKTLYAGTGGGMRGYDVTTGRHVVSGPGVPYAISEDGQLMAAGGAGDAAFLEMGGPKAVVHLTAHRSGINRVKWSGNGKWFASLDGQFAVRVWEAESGRLVATFNDLPPGTMFGTNAAVALSYDGDLLAYSSGGITQSSVRIVRVSTGKVELQTEIKPGGYDWLACTGGNNFRLVREELQPAEAGHEPNVYTVVYDVVNNELRRWPKPLRVSRPDDDGYYLNASLSSDGSWYAWWGPRSPSGTFRHEVWDLTNPAAPRFVLEPARREVMGEYAGHMSPDGKFLWAIRQWKTRDGRETVRTRYSLADKNPLESETPVPQVPMAVSLDGKSMAFYVEPDGHRRTHAVAITRDGRTVIELPLRSTAAPNETFWFSPDGRFIVYGEDDGTIGLANLNALEAKVAEFRRSVGR